MRKLIAANWKMNGNLEFTRAFIARLANEIEQDKELLSRFDFLICPPFPYLHIIRHALLQWPHVALGAQDCSAYEDGARTGDISARMLSDCSCDAVIIGHSERRMFYGENDELIRKKIIRASGERLKIILCVGETLEEREAGKAQDVVKAQLDNALIEGLSAETIAIAYEPVWAIGTGKVAQTHDIEAMHAFIYGNIKEQVADLEKLRILYGGSVKPDNAKDILSTPYVGGALVGGASLQVDSFLGIARNS